jgi:hypothetical protein
MKKVFIMLIGLMFISDTYAQKSLELKGPQAKNSAYKVKKRMNIVTRSVPLALKGPAAKNHLRRGLKSGEAYTPISSSPRIFIKSPAAKQYQPKIQTFESNVFRKRIGEE